MERLILLHGALGAADQLVCLQEILKNDFEVYLFEFSGHGHKANLNLPFTVAGFIQELNTFIESIDKKVHIFGHSMGGFIAMLAAAEGNASIKSITTLGTKMFWNAEIALNETKNLNAVKIREKVPLFAAVMQKRHGVHWADLLKRTADFMHTLGAENPIQEAVMKQIKCPVQLLLAEHDQLVSEEETLTVKRWIHQATFSKIPDSSHPIEKVNMDFLAERIKVFIQSDMLAT
mgnify:CR=1 FL=1